LKVTHGAEAEIAELITAVQDKRFDLNAAIQQGHQTVVYFKKRKNNQKVQSNQSGWEFLELNKPPAF
jgi:hypothetical protein